MIPFSYCAICAKPIFYPLNKWLVGTNLCLRHDGFRRLRPVLRAKALWRSIYRSFFHGWHLKGGLIPYDLNKPTLYELRGYFPRGYKNKLVTRWRRDKVFTDSLNRLIIIRDILRGKIYGALFQPATDEPAQDSDGGTRYKITSGSGKTEV